jgi:hypothetical protein
VVSLKSGIYSCSSTPTALCCASRSVSSAAPAKPRCTRIRKACADVNCSPLAEWSEHPFRRKRRFGAGCGHAARRSRSDHKYHSLRRRAHGPVALGNGSAFRSTRSRRNRRCRSAAWRFKDDGTGGPPAVGHVTGIPCLVGRAVMRKRLSVYVQPQLGVLPAGHALFHDRAGLVAMLAGKARRRRFGGLSTLICITV